MADSVAMPIVQSLLALFGSASGAESLAAHLFNQQIGVLDDLFDGLLTFCDDLCAAVRSVASFAKLVGIQILTFVAGSPGGMAHNALRTSVGAPRRWPLSQLQDAVVRVPRPGPFELVPASLLRARQPSWNPRGEDCR